MAAGAETASRNAVESAATGDDWRLVWIGEGVFGVSSLLSGWVCRACSRSCFDRSFSNRSNSKRSRSMRFRCCFNSLNFFFSVISLPRGFFNPPRARITSCPLFVFGLYKLLAAITTPAMLARQIQRLQKSAGSAGIPVDSGEAMASFGMLPDESFVELLLPALYPTNDPYGKQWHKMETLSCCEEII